MNALVFTARALVDLQRLADFLWESNPNAALATAGIVFEALEVLVHSPEIGRKVRFGNRELAISRGQTGYLALYKFLPATAQVLVLALRHQREAGYKA